MPILRVENLSFSYDQKAKVLNNIHLTFDRKPTAIIGQNGAGKTTFVRLLKKLLVPTEGEIFYRDRNLKNITAAELAKDIGLVFQNPNDQIFKSRVLDEVMFGPLNIYRDEETAKDKALKALEAVHLTPYIDKNPYDLSLAERKLISIASVIAMEPEVIIFDEPTMGQDIEGKEIIKNIINQLNERGKLVITILHDIDFAAEVFKRIIVFNKGEVLLDGHAEKVFQEKKLLEEAHLEQPMVMKIGEQLGLKKPVITRKQLIHDIVKHKELPSN